MLQCFKACILLLNGLPRLEVSGFNLMVFGILERLYLIS